jgi:predicted MFS family arabinose efflux permease
MFLKLVGELPGYMYSKESSSIYVNLFIGSEAKINLDGQEVLVKQTTRITDAQCGWLVTVIYLATGLLAFPVSLIIDRWSRTKTIGIMAIVWSLATAASALTGNYAQLFMARILIGFGQAGFASGGNAMISAMYPINQRARMMGLWNASIPMGSAIGVAVGGIIAQSVGWRYAFPAIAIPGLIVSVLFLFIKDYKTVDLSFIDESNVSVKMEKKEMIREFVNKPSILFTYFGKAILVFVTTAMIVWLPTYFEKELSMETKTAGSMAGGVMLLALIGSPLGGYVTDKWRLNQPRARLLLPSLSALLSSVLLFISFFLAKGTMQIAFLFMFGVVVMTFLSGAAAVTQDVIHPGLRATSYAIAMTIMNLPGSIAPVVIGRISDLSGIRTAMEALPVVLIAGALLFYLGSRYYLDDMKKVAKVQLEVA